MGRTGSQSPARGVAYHKHVNADVLRAKKKMVVRMEEEELLDLPKAERRTLLRDGRCCYCLRGPFDHVSRHVVMAHKIGADQLKEDAGIIFSEGLCSEKHRAKFAELARARGTFSAGNTLGKGSGRRPRRISTEGLRRVRENLALATDDMRRAALVKGRPNRAAWGAWRAYVKQERMEHGTRDMYQVQGCRCLTCRASNTWLHAQWVAKSKGRT